MRTTTNLNATPVLTSRHTLIAAPKSTTGWLNNAGNTANMACFHKATDKVTTVIVDGNIVTKPVVEASYICIWNSKIKYAEFIGKRALYTFTYIKAGNLPQLPKGGYVITDIQPLTEVKAQPEAQPSDSTSSPNLDNKRPNTHTHVRTRVEAVGQIASKVKDNVVTATESLKDKLTTLTTKKEESQLSVESSEHDTNMLHKRLEKLAELKDDYISEGLNHHAIDVEMTHIEDQLIESSK